MGADVECVIHSSAVSGDNLELRRAAELGIPFLSYAEMLGQLIAGHRGLAVAGTHGKSTTTAMAAEILVAAGCDPTVIHGAVPRDGGDGGRAGKGNTVLVEACEFRQNFLHLRPHDAVILNIEPDHFDCYDSREALESAFARFAALLPPDGRLIVPWGDEAVQRVAAAAGCRAETFGQYEPADWVAAGVQGQRGKYGFDLIHRGQNTGSRQLSVFGSAQCFSTPWPLLQLSAVAAYRQKKSSVDFHVFVVCDADWNQLERRAGSSFWDDYAHHPTEISTTLQTIREAAPDAPGLSACFNPTRRCGRHDY